MFKKRGIFLSLFLGAISAFAGNSLKDALTFYEDCEDLKSPYSGAKIQQSIRIVEQGKFGKAMLIERRTVNAVPNGDFKNEKDDSWTIPENATFLKSGGVKNSSCLELKTGEPAALPLTELMPGKPHAFSLYAKANAPDSSLSIEINCGGKNRFLLKDKKLTENLERIKLSFYPENDSATLRIYAKGAAIIDNAMLDKGVSFFNSFSEPLKMRYVDRIELEPDKGFFNPAKGAISCWIKAPWLTNKTFSSNGLAIFQALNAENKKEKWGDHVIMTINAWTKRKMNDPNDKGKFYAFCIDARGRSAVVNALMEEIPENKNGWRHLLVNWEYKENKMRVEMFLDGGLIHISKTKQFGPLKKLYKIYIGYAGGGYLNGLLDDFAIFNRPLTEKEVKTISSSSKSLAKMLDIK